VISAWCFHNSAGGEVIIGRLPKYALVTDISIYVETAFNAGSPTIQVGNESFANIYMDAAAAVSAQGYATISLTDYAQFQSSAADTAVAYITPSGSSAGKALVTMTYINGPVPS
jgi:hypothetical protein